MEKHVLLKKLRDSLESLKGRVAGRNKDDVEDAIAMVSSFGDKVGEYVLHIPFFLINRYSCFSIKCLKKFCEGNIVIKYSYLYSMKIMVSVHVNKKLKMHSE